VLGQVRVGFALCNDPFEVMPARELEQTIPLTFDVIAAEETFRSFGHYSAKPEFAVNQRQVTSVLSVAKPAHLFFIVRARMIVPQNVECIKDWLGSAE
jgi:hypothetical protein